MTREIVQAATFQRVSSGLLICGKLWVFALLLCAIAPSTGAQPVAGNSPPADVALTSSHGGRTHSTKSRRLPTRCRRLAVPCGVAAAGLRAAVLHAKALS
jgi:hypothetical protein